MPDIALFQHAIELRVRNYEVDWQGIVHNANYLLYFETGRIEYLKSLGIVINIDRIQDDARIVVVRNEINYRTPLTFDDRVTVRTRIHFVRETSFGFEGLICRSGSSDVVADNIAIHVWLDASSGRPTRVTDKFRKIVLDFEGNRALIPPEIRP